MYKNLYPKSQDIISRTKRDFIDEKIKDVINMKIIFEGLNRHVRTHSREIYPYQYNNTVWHSANIIKGEVYELGLSGNFRVEINFDDSDLKSWLEKYIDEEPEKALFLISEIQFKAINKLFGQKYKLKTK